MSQWLVEMLLSVLGVEVVMIRAGYDPLEEKPAAEGEVLQRKITSCGITPIASTRWLGPRLGRTLRS
jgi:hypothetical protein